MNQSRFRKLFPEQKPIIGMLHLAGYSEQDILERARKELLIFEQQGLSAAIIENYENSKEMVYKAAPFLRAVKDDEGLNIKLGVNILPNDFQESIPLASQNRFDFVQLDYVSGRYGPDEFLDVESYRKIREKFPDIVVLGGVWPKYYKPIDPSEQELNNDLEEAIQRADAIVVTGAKTGEETPLGKITYFRKRIRDYPLVIGAGLKPHFVDFQLTVADAAIVGSYFKNGNTRAEVDLARIKEFMERVNKLKEKNSIKIN